MARLLAPLLTAIVFASSATLCFAGKSWKPVGDGTWIPVIYPHMAVHPANGGTPVVVYAVADGQPCGRCSPAYSGYAQAFSPVGWLDLGRGLGAGPEPANEIKVALHPKQPRDPWVAYRDNHNGFSCSVQRWDRKLQSWAAVQEQITTDSVARVNFDMSSLKLGPVVCFQDSSKGGAAACMQYKKFPNSTLAFDYIGGAISPAGADWLSMAIWKDTIYVAYADLGSTPVSQRGRVAKWTGSAWVPVGDFFSSGEIVATSIAINPDTNQPWVAFQGDLAGTPALNPPRPLRVLKFVPRAGAKGGGDWKPVFNKGLSGPGFQGVGSSTHSLAFAPRKAGVSQPWVAYQCDTNRPWLCVQALGPQGWAPQGPPQPASAGEATEITLAFGPTGVPFVSYRDNGRGGSAFVKAYL